jgi:hypothetical protein
MPAFGLNRFTQAYAVAVNDAGTRIADKPISCVDRLARDLFEWGGAKSLKVNFRFIYPFVGGTAISNAFNLADPTTGQITWSEDANIIHGPTGWLADGTAGMINQADTGITDDPVVIANYSVMYGIYCRTANAVGGLDMVGNFSTTPNSNLIGFYCRHTDGRAYFWSGSNVTSPPSTNMAFAVTNSQGLFSALRLTGGSHYGYRNGALLGSSAVAPGFVPTAGTAGNWMLVQSPLPRNYAFAFLTNMASTPGIGVPFTTAAQATLYSLVQAFQVRLGRSV